MSKFPLRPYQVEAVDAVFKAWSEGMRRPAVVMATGSGKTVVFSHIIQRHRAEGGGRTIVLVHRDELVRQAVDKIRGVAPELSVGVVRAEENDTRSDVMVCSVQTLSRPTRLREVKQLQDNAGRVGLVLTDEVHHCPARSYQTIYGAFPDSRWVGFTATLERGDGVGLGSQIDDVVFTRSPLWMMKHGYLVQPRAFTQDMGVALSSVKRTAGDYQSADLGRALEESEVAGQLPAAWRKHADGRPTVVFTPTVATAQQVSDAFIASGVTSSVVSGETPREDRQRIFEDSRNGRCSVIVNCMVMTEGTDLPWLSCAVIARPTSSRPLYIQMVGRVLRPWHGKTDAVILNVAGAGGKLATLVDLEPGAVEEVKEGETLEEAIEREAEENANGPVTSNRKLELREVTSLFEASHSAWLMTRGGVMFIGAGEYTYFLWPSREGEPGTWDVCWISKGGQASITPHTGLPAEMAMSWAEAEAEDHGSFSVSRKASWRKGKPSEAQLGFAAQLGIDTTDMGKAEVSDAISIARESRRLDPHLNPGAYRRG